MAFSPERVVKDPFGFDEPPAAKTASQSHATPFDAFEAPAPVSSGSRGSSSSFDAFGSTPAPATSAASPSFDAFGSPVKTTQATTAFDAFGASSSSTASSSFDAFGASTPAVPVSSPFDAFGGSSASASAGGFGDFASATLARSSSGTLPVADPFSAFSPRVSSGSNKVPEPAAAADPFAAFDAVDAGVPSASIPADRSTGSFGATGPSNNVFGASTANQSAGAGLGFPGSNVPNNDPFAFAGNSGSKSNSFSNPGVAGSHQTNGGGASPFAQGFPGAGANPYQQQQHQPQQFAPNANQMYNPMGMQQQPASHQQQGYPQQQQWYGHPQQQQYSGQHPGQQLYPGQHPGQFPHHPSAGNGGMPSAIPVQAKVRTNT